MAKKKNEIKTEDLGILLRNCRLYYKLGVVPQSAEVLDSTPLAVPFNCEKPLTRREMFQEFGYGTFKNNPNLYDDGDESVSYSEFPEHSQYILDEEHDLTLEEAQAIDEAKKQERANVLLEKYGMEDVLSPHSDKNGDTTEEPKASEGDSQSTVPAS